MIASAMMKIPTIWNIFFLSPTCMSAVRNITNTHMAQGLKPSINHKTKLELVSDSVSRFTSPKNGIRTTLSIDVVHEFSIGHVSALVLSDIFSPLRSLRISLPLVSALSKPWYTWLVSERCIKGTVLGSLCSLASSRNSCFA